jgi:hypothetical protein
VELRRGTVGRGVVAPADRARRTVQSEELAGAGADVKMIPRDRGGDEDSASGVVSPEDRIGGRKAIGRESQGEKCFEDHVLILRVKSSRPSSKRKCLRG